MRGSRRWHRRSGEGEDGRLEVLSGKWVHIRVVGYMDKDVDNLRPIAGRRRAGGRTGSRGRDRGRRREEARRRRNRGGRRRSSRWKERARGGRRWEVSGKNEARGGGGNCAADVNGL